MPQYFKDAGYSTALIGKWHLGQEYRNMTPNARGYDYFFGNLGKSNDHFPSPLILSIGVAVDHYSKTIGLGCGSEENYFHDVFADNCRFFNAYDLQENGHPFVDQSTFLSDLLADKAVHLILSHNTSTPLFLSFHPNAPHPPVQSPQRYVDLCQGVSESEYAFQPYFRQKVCGMVVSLDIALLRILLALSHRGMLSSTLLFYMSDNGGLPQAGSSNLPFKGGKGSVHEGGVHVPAFAYGYGLHSRYTTPPRVTDLFHVSDVLPTLLGYANMDVPQAVAVFDGFNHWNNLISGQPLSRKHVALEAGSIVVGFFSGYIEKAFGKTWKYMFNPNVLIYTGLHPARDVNSSKYRIEGEFLFDLTNDPTETRNLIPYIDHFTNTNAEILEILNLIRFNTLSLRATGVKSLLKGLPIKTDILPSMGGCWLPLDSPHYDTFLCPVSAPHTPHNVFETYNLSSIAPVGVENIASR
jgi:arylsulfatase B